MSNNYAYLKKFVGQNDFKGNYFLPLKREDIIKAEEQMGQPFPSQLRRFYEEIGSGILSCGERYLEMLVRSVANEILPPHIAVDYMQGIIEHPDGDSYYMSKDT